MSSSKYPTRQAIIDEMAKFPDITPEIAALTLWKDEQYIGCWKSKTLEMKINALTKLAYSLYYEGKYDVKDKPTLYVVEADRYAYHPGRNVVIIDSTRASILSTLHELGHAFYGDSELLACAFSVKLFAKVFPKEFAKLEWHGHMLRQRR